MTDDVARWLAARGAPVGPDGSVEHGGDPAVEASALRERCVAFDASAHLRLLGTGPDLLGLLQRLSTGDVAALKEGQGAATVLTTAKGRIVERLFVHHGGSLGCLLVGSGNGEDRVTAHLEKYTFAEQTGLSSVATSTVQLALLGPAIDPVLQRAGWDRPAPYGTVLGELDGTPLWILGHDGETSDGVSLVVDRQHATSLCETVAAGLETAGGRFTGASVVDLWRLERGIPIGDVELTEDHNPLEVGLWDAVSFAKGCYVGQEVVARLNTYDKVSRELAVARFEPTPDLPAHDVPLHDDDRVVGQLTRWRGTPGSAEAIGLALVKKRHEVVGRDVRLGGPAGPVARLSAVVAADRTV